MGITSYSYIAVLPTISASQMFVLETFKASNHQLGSAMKPDNERSDLPAVTHQNGFSSTITVGVPTFHSRFL
jgi:hypothetical protein